MGPLAIDIYEVLRTRVPGARPEISYTDLIRRLPARWNAITPDGDPLRFALKEIVDSCRDARLPALSAIVVNHHTKVPGRGYYVAAHPNEAHDEALAMVAWSNEVILVRKATYPPTLP